MALSDTEALDLIQHYRWAVLPQCGGGWVVEGDDGTEDGVRELARTRGQLREAVGMAMRRQAGLD